MAKIGIDFGTSYTTVSRFNSKSGKAEVIRIQGEEKLPSMLYFTSTSDIPVVGVEAYNVLENCYGLNNQSEVFIRLMGIISGLKKDMTPDGIVYVPSGKSYSYSQLIAFFFSFIKKEVETTCFNGEPVTDVCITYPATFESYKRDILKDAAKQAGFYNIKLLMEPIAAAIGYDAESGNENGVLIYDFGGGTFDLAYVKFDNTGDYITLPPKGNPSCGGDAIDLLLYNEWDKIVFNQSQTHIARNGEKNLPFLKHVCKRQKEFLSTYFRNMDQYTLEANIGGQYYSMNISKSYWTNLISPIVDTTIDITKRMIEEIKAEKLPLSKVLLIGGSSKLPLVYERLKEISPIIPHPIPESDLAVSLGAAVFINQGGIKKINKWCRKCGSTLDTSVKFCRHCGTPNCRYDYRFDALL